MHLIRYSQQLLADRLIQLRLPQSQLKLELSKKAGQRGTLQASGIELMPIGSHRDCLHYSALIRKKRQTYHLNFILYHDATTLVKTFLIPCYFFFCFWL